MTGKYTRIKVHWVALAAIPIFWTTVVAGTVSALQTSVLGDMTVDQLTTAVNADNEVMQVAFLSAPRITTFTIPSTSSSLTVSGITLIATDTSGVTGYFLSENSSTPAASASGWSVSSPKSYTFSSAGVKTLYAWAKNAAGRVSSSRSASVTITLTDTKAPTVSQFSIPATSSSLTLSGISLTASDNVGVTGYLLTASSTKPSASATGWSATVPTSYTFASAGAKTLYAWAKDAAGNVSNSLSASVMIDTTAPAVTAFSIPAASNSLTVSGISVTASDAVGVTGYLLTASSTKPSAGASGWSATAPTSYTFTSAGAKTLYAWAKDAAGNVSTSLSASVTIDTAAPVVSNFSIPAASSSLTLSGISVTASDNVGVTGYLLTASSTKPSAGASGWSATAPASYTFTSAGVKTLYAWAKDAAGNVSNSLSASVMIDTAAPVVSNFSIPPTASSLTLSGISLIASDDVGVTGYLLTENSTTPLASASGWSGSVPTSYIFASAGVKTLYAWAKDAAGNVSTSLSASVTIDTTAPVVSNFSIPATSNSLTVSGISVTASDSVGVTGYLLSESSTKPSAGASGWSATAPASYTFTSAGVKTLYAWAKDAAGNVSTSLNAQVTITVPDTTAPVVSNFSIPAASSSPTLSGISVTASDNVGVTGYMLTESSTQPSASASGWSATAPASYTFASAGAKTLYAWAKDAAGNVSNSLSASVMIDTAAPVVSNFSIPPTASSLTLSGISLIASDDVGVTGYLLTENSTTPLASASGWSGSVPTSYIFASAGVKTLYAWVKDAAGNVSASLSSTVIVTVSDTIPPTVTITNPTSNPTYVKGGTSSINISGTSSDNVAVSSVTWACSTCSPTSGTAAGTTSWAISSIGLASGSNVITTTAHDSSDNTGTDILTVTYTPSGTAAVTMASGNAVRAPWYGFGVNWQTYSYTTSTPSSSDWTNTYVPRLQWMKPGIVRLMMGAVYAGYPNTPNWNSASMTQLYRVLDYCQANSISVQIVEWGDDFIRPSGWVLGDTNWTNAIGAYMQYLTQTKGYTCIKWFTLGNEPNYDSYNFASEGAWATAITAVKNKFASLGLSGFTVAGPDSSDTDSWVTNAASSYNSLIGAYDMHRYEYASSLASSGLETNLTSTVWNSVISSDPNQTGKPFIIGEAGFYDGATSSTNTNIATYNYGLWMADYGVQVARAKVGGIAAWTLDNDGVNYLDWGLWDHKANGYTLRPWWYTWSLLSHCVPAGSTIYAPTNPSSSVRVLGAQTTTGKWSYVAVNEGSSSVTLNFIAPSGSSSQNFKSYLYTSSTDTTALPSPFTTISAIPTSGVVQTIPATSVVVVSSVDDDTTAPSVTAFTIPSTSTSLTFSITAFTASDDVGVTGYLITESSTPPSSGNSGWNPSASTTYTAISLGSHTLYAWARDAAGNVSASLSSTVIVTLPDTTPPAVTAFTVPSTASSFTVPISVFSASDNVGVTGYCLTESSGYAGCTWSGTAPASYTFTAAGSRTLYAWARDAAGNVSASLSSTVIVTLPDTTPPAVTAFTVPSTASSLTVPVSAFSASDNVGVTGYCLTESAGYAGCTWSGTAPASYTFTATGSRTLYAWATDAAGNVSASLSANVTITLQDWQLIFSDEFNGTDLDLNIWQTTYADGSRTNNDELEGYADDAFSVSNGQLHLRADKRTVTLPDNRTYDYTSGLINNSRAFSQPYGYFEMRAAIPGGNGFWPAFWLLPLSGEWSPAIDVMEVLSSQPTILYMTLHWGNPSDHQMAQGQWSGPDFTTTGLHVYAMDWTSDSIIWYVDGVEKYRIQGNPNIPTVPMYVIANLAVGGSWGGVPDSNTVFPSSMDIDYIRIWQRTPSGGYPEIPGPNDPIPNKLASLKGYPSIIKSVKLDGKVAEPPPKANTGATPMADVKGFAKSQVEIEDIFDIMPPWSCAQRECVFYPRKHYALYLWFEKVYRTGYARMIW